MPVLSGGCSGEGEEEEGDDKTLCIETMPTDLRRAVATSVYSIVSCMYKLR